MAVTATPLYRRALLLQSARTRSPPHSINGCAILSTRPSRIPTATATLSQQQPRQQHHSLLARSTLASPAWRTQQTRTHVSSTRAALGHGHSHGVLGFGDHNDDDDETDAMRQRVSEADTRAADRITWAGIYINVALSGVKACAGVACHSSALLADAAHSMSDLVSDGITLVALKYCARPPDARQPYGYGKYETVGALSVSLLLVGGSIGIVGHSFETLALLLSPAVSMETQLAALALEPEVIASIKAATAAPESFLAHHAHSTAAAAADSVMLHPAALGIAAVSVAAKEALYRATIAIGRKINSSVLVANAWHHRSDAATSVVAMSGIGLSLAGFPVFDPLAGMLVGGIILKMGAEIGYSAVRELCDAQLPAPLVQSLTRAVESVVHRSDGDIVAVKQLRSRRIGRNVHVDVTLVMKSGSSGEGTEGSADALSFERACVWKDEVKAAIRAQVPRVKDIVVELATPQQSQSTVFDDAEPQVSQSDACQLHDDPHSHGHSHGHGHSH